MRGLIFYEKDDAMRGHVRKRGSSYCIVVDIGQDPKTGKRKQKWVSGFKTKKEAEKALTDMINKVNQGNFVEPIKKTLSEYLIYWLETYARQNVSFKTFRRYSDIIRLYISPYIGQTKLSDLRPSIIQELYSASMKSKTEGGLGLSSASAIYIHRVLYQALKHAVKWQLLSRNPADSVERPKNPKTEINVISEEQVNLLILHLVGNQAYVPTYLAITTGMRRGEICGLKWLDIDFEKEVIYVRRSLQRINGILQEKSTKTQKSNRVIALSSQCVNFLREHKKTVLKQSEESVENLYVCCWPNLNPMDPDYLTHKFFKISKRLGINARFHDLRHFHATILLKEGIHPKVVSERLGHSKIGVTMDTYSHVLPQIQKEAAEKLDKLLLTTPFQD